MLRTRHATHIGNLLLYCTSWSHSLLTGTRHVGTAVVDLRGDNWAPLIWACLSGRSGGHRCTCMSVFSNSYFIVSMWKLSLAFKFIQWKCTRATFQQRASFVVVFPQVSIRSRAKNGHFCKLLHNGKRCHKRTRMWANAQRDGCCQNIDGALCWKWQGEELL